MNIISFNNLILVVRKIILVEKVKDKFIKIVLENCTYESEYFDLNTRNDAFNEIEKMIGKEP